MTDRSSQAPAEEVMTWVEMALEKRSAALGLPFKYTPELAGQVFAGAFETKSTRLEAADLPERVRAVRVGRYSVIIGMLPDAPDRDAIVEGVRRMRNQCVVARSYLSQAAAIDLHALLVGPRGSQGADRWRPLALLAERDERVARKLVWLRPAGIDFDEASFDDFCKRTFLARPWITDGKFSKAALDNVSGLASSADVPRNTAGEWARLASDSELDSDALVDGLVDAWTIRSQP